MNEMDKLGILEKKLSGICDKNDLLYKFCNDRYPITLTIRPAGGMDNQISMLESSEADEGNYTSPDASIMFAFKDGELIYRTSKTFTIPDALFAKVKNLFKKMHALYCQYVHRTCVDNKVTLPEIVVPEDDEDIAERFEYDPNDEPDDDAPEDDYDDDDDEESSAEYEDGEEISPDEDMDG